MPISLRTVVAAVGIAVSMLLCAIAGRRQRLPLVALVLLSFCWFAIDGDFEGPTLLRVSQTHGLTLADLFGVAGLAAAGWLWLNHRPRR